MSDSRDQTLEAIREQGDLVRTLKAAKEAPEKVRVFLVQIMWWLFLDDLF